MFGNEGNDFLVGNLLAGINSFDCGEDDEGPNGIDSFEGDVVWWDGGDGALIDDLGDADASNDILADDVLLSDNCENVFNLLSPTAGDPLPPTV